MLISCRLLELSPQDMTTNPTSNFRLDPLALAASIPLRRVGTPEVWYLFHPCTFHFADVN
jgi:hypothetical protein